MVERDLKLDLPSSFFKHGVLENPPPLMDDFPGKSTTKMDDFPSCKPPFVDGIFQLAMWLITEGYVFFFEIWVSCGYVAMSSQCHPMTSWEW